MCVTIRGARVEGRGLRLRDLLDFAEQLAGGGLVETNVVRQAARLYGVQQAKRADAVHVSCVLCQLEGDLDKRKLHIV